MAKLLPKDFSTAFAPSAGNYLNVGKIDSAHPLRFNIVDEDQILVGYEAWGENSEGVKKPFRFVSKPTDSEIEAELAAAGFSRRMDFTRTGLDPAKPFVAFPVYVYEEEAIKVASFTQKTIVQDIDRISQIDDFSDLTTVDLILTRTKNTNSNMIEYKTDAVPQKATTRPVVKKAWQEVKEGFDIKRMLTGGDPFTADESAKP